MGRLLSKSHIYNALIIFGLLCSTTALMAFPRESVEAAKSGVALCFDVIIPSLFPFFVISSLSVNLGLTKRLSKLFEPVMRPLFGVCGACSCAMIMGFLGGYPVGAKTAISLYENGECSKSEAERMLSWCNNSGPAFILGVVGAGIFSNGTVGLLLYISHIISSLLVGIMFRRYGDSKITDTLHKKHTLEIMHSSFSEAFVSSVSGSFTSVLGICGFVIFFTVIIKLLFLSGLIPVVAAFIGRIFSPIGMDECWAQRLLTGIIELSSGVSSLAPAANELSSSMAMAAFMLGWAGLSVHCQVLSFIGSSKLRFSSYIIGKFFHGIISAVLVFIFSKLLFKEKTVALVLASQVRQNASSGFLRNISICCVCALIVFLAMLFLSKKHTGKKG